MGKTLVIMTEQLKTKLFINNKSYEIENGILELSLDEVLYGGESSLHKFDEEVSEYLPQEKRVALYKTMLQFKHRFGFNDIAMMTGVDKSTAKTLVAIGARNELVIKFESQWRLKPEKREHIDALIRALSPKKKDDEEGPGTFRANDPVNEFHDVEASETEAINKKQQKRKFSTLPRKGGKNVVL